MRLLGSDGKELPGTLYGKVVASVPGQQLPIFCALHLGAA